MDHLEVDINTTSDILERLTNFTSSYFKDGLFGNHPYKNSVLIEQLNFFRFRDSYTNIFANLFTILSRLDITKEQFAKSKLSLTKFLKIEEELAWFDLREFEHFVIIKGNLFEEEELKNLLKISIDRDRYGYNKYTELIKISSKAIKKYYPSLKITNINLIKSAILKSCSEDGTLEDYSHLVPLVNICNDICKRILLDTFNDYLCQKFHRELYEELLWETDFNFDTNNYFQLYSEEINLYKGNRAYKYGKNKLTDYVFINYVFLIYKLQIDLKRQEFKVFTGLNDFEAWLLSPIDFDYNRFDAKWLIDIHDTIIIKQLKNNEKIGDALEEELKREYNIVLAEIKYSYFI